MTDLYRDSTSAAASTSEHRLCGACHRCLATVRCTFCRAVARIESSALIAKKSVCTLAIGLLVSAGTWVFFSLRMDKHKTYLKIYLNRIMHNERY